MHPTRITIALITLLTLGLSVRAQAQHPESKDASGSIAGRLTLNGRGVPNLEVALQGASSAQSVTSDEDGYYRVTGLTAGQYAVIPLNSAYVIRSDNRTGSSSKTVTLKEGETLEGLDFALVRGGVITGKVTSAEGQPVIAKRIDLAWLDEQRRRRPLPELNYWMFETDDRGVYRLYGLPAGRYLVGAGDNQYRFTARGAGAVFYPLTYYPGVSEEAQATIIEVREGSETANIDLQLGHPAKLLSASGRIVTETGQPVPNMGYGKEELGSDGKTRGSFTGGTSTATNAQGEFRLDALRPGYYKIYAMPDDDQNLYTETIIFEVTDHDLTDLKVIVRRGGTIKGVVALDGNQDPDLLKQLSGFMVAPLQTALDSPMLNRAYIENDGSFVMTKLRAGKVQLAVGPLFGTGFTLARVECNGMEQPEGIEVRSGEDVTGVRLVFAYGENIIRGQVKIEGGTVPDGSVLAVSFARLGATGPLPSFSTSSRVNEQGQFTIEGLAAGEYELRLQLIQPHFFPGQSPSSTALVTQRVTVTNGPPTQVTFILNLAAKDKEEQR